MHAPHDCLGLIRTDLALDAPDPSTQLILVPGNPCNLIHEAELPAWRRGQGPRARHEPGRRWRCAGRRAAARGGWGTSIPSSRDFARSYRSRSRLILRSGLPAASARLRRLHPPPPPTCVVSVASAHSASDRLRLDHRLRLRLRPPPAPPCDLCLRPPDLAAAGVRRHASSR